MEENNNISHIAPDKESAVKGTNGWAIAGFVASFFTTIIALILSIVGIVEAKKRKWNHSLKGLAIAGLIISILKLIGTIVIVILVVTIFNKFNFIDCINATNCVEQDDGSYICEKDGKSVTCLFNYEDIDYEYDSEIYDDLDDLIDDTDIDLEINLVDSGYSDYDEVVTYLINNNYNLTFTYKTAEKGSGNLNDLSKQLVITDLQLFTPVDEYDGELSGYLDYITVAFKTEDNIEYYLTIYDVEGTTVVVIDNYTDNVTNSYIINPNEDIFELI